MYQAIIQVAFCVFCLANLFCKTCHFTLQKQMQGYEHDMDMIDVFSHFPVLPTVNFACFKSVSKILIPSHRIWCALLETIS